MAGVQSRYAAAVFALVATFAGRAQGQETPQAAVYDRRALTLAFLESSPELALADARVQLREAETSAATSLPAPELEIQAWNVPFRRPYALNEAMMWMAMVRQTFEPRGLRAERRHAAEERSRGEQDARVDTSLRVADEAARLHAELAMRSAERDAMRLERDAMLRLLEATRTRIPSGSGAIRDVIAVEAELANVENGLTTAEVRRAATERVINARLGRELDAPIDVVVDETALDARSLRALLERHPALRAATSDRLAARSALRMAEIEARRPRMTASAGVFEQPPVMSGMDRAIGYGLGIGIELPWIGGRARGAERVARAELAMADAEIDAQVVRLRTELEIAIGDLDAATIALASYDERTLPALERLVDASIRGLPSGTTRIADVLDARRALASAQVERSRRLGERLAAEATLFALAAVLATASEPSP